MRQKVCIILLAAAMLSVLAATNCWAIKIGIYGAEGGLLNVQTALVGTGLFAAADIQLSDIRGYTPTLTSLSTYDAVLVYSNYSFFDRVALGNVLADYVDAGGGVVVATFGSTEGAPGSGYDLSVQGRLATSSYMPWSYDGWGDGASGALGAYDAGHPIMEGVSSITTGGWWDKVIINPGATLVASWANGVPLAATNHAGQVVGLGFYPNGDASVTGGDYARMIANALMFADHPTSTIGGQVLLENFTGDVSSMAVRIELTPASGPVRTETTVLNATGNYVIRDVTPGTYSVTFKACQFLRKAVPGGVTIGVADSKVVNVSLVNGDTDGNNAVADTDINQVLPNIDQNGD